MLGFLRSTSIAAIVLLLLVRPASAVTRICVDPGHGGSQCPPEGNSPYNVGSTGYCAEKSMNLTVASSLAYFLSTDRRFAVTQTRLQDQCVSLAQRVAIADGVGANAFVSIHHNGILEPGANVDNIESFLLHGTSGAQSPFITQSQLLGGKLTNWLCSQFSYPHDLQCSHPLRQDISTGETKAVLRDNARPAIISEAAWVWTPAADEICLGQLTASDQAYALYTGLKDYFQILDTPVGTSFHAAQSSAHFVRLTWEESDPLRHVFYYVTQSDNCWGPFYYCTSFWSGDEYHTIDNHNYYTTVSADYNRQYWYRLEVVDETVFANVTKTLGDPVVAIASPTNVAAVGQDLGAGAARVTVSWNAVPGAAVYYVFRSAVNGMANCNSPMAVIGNTASTSYIDNAAPNSTPLFYRVKAWNATQGSAISSEASILISPTVSVVASNATSVSLLAVSPNPSIRNATVVLASPNGTRVELDVYDVSGRRIVKVPEVRVGGGIQRVALFDNSSRSVNIAAGVYFLRVRCDGREMARRRIVLLR